MKLRLWRSMLFILLLGWAFIGPDRPAHGSTALAGKLIYLQGEVHLQRASLRSWEKPKLGDSLFAGDVVKTGPASIAAILCVDESQIKLHENTVLELKSVMPSPRLRLTEVVPAALEKAASSLYGVSQGEVWLRNNKETFRFELETPAVTAGIRGTEFNLRVSSDGTTHLTLLQGMLRLANPQGELILNPGEEGIARPGQAPTKRLVLQPEDAVQWSLYYPGIFSYRDIPLAPGLRGTGPVEKAALLYDQGRLSEAREAVAAVLRQAPADEHALTLLGWIHLQENYPLKAVQTFQQVPRPGVLAVVGLALARYRLGKLLPAYESVQAARQQLETSPLLWTMEGYFALLAARVQESQTCLEQALKLAPENILARTQLAQMWLVQNRKAAARQEASRTLALAPQSPAALFTLALVEIAHFNPAAAKTHLEKAIKADPGFVPAYVYLAKIWLGGDYLERAGEIINAAGRLAPEEGEVLSLAGFVRLGLRDYQGAKKYFEQAIKANPGLGEPHLGMGIYYFRYREPKTGLAEMLTATLLEPRVSLYQSTLGKALYQVRAFDKALEVYDYAKALDQNDPTPHLYKGIALTDLNRPGEAIQEINQSIALNDNNAIFRSRLMLDRDLAVRNFNLSRAYNQLGLGEWAYSKAVTAVKKDPLNSSARLFLANAYINTRQRLASAGSELLLHRLLSPANQNTFIVYNDYTPMFEMPYLRVQAQGGIGTWGHSRAIQDHSLEVYGGIPGVAFDVFGGYQEDDGFRPKNSDEKAYTSINYFKWEPTVRNSVLASFRFRDSEAGDISNLNDFGFINSPNQRQFSRLRFYELGYVHRINPRATFLGYLTYATTDYHLKDKTYDTLSFFGLPLTQISTLSRCYDQEFYNLQFQQQLILGDHTLIGGVDYFSGHLKYKYDELLEYFLFNIPLASYQIADNFRPPNRSYTLYLQDYWQVTPQLLAELGIFYDHTRNSRAGLADPVSLERWNPRLGLNYQVTADHILRLVLQYSVNTHNLMAPLLVPAEIASFPWQINVDDGSEMREVGVAWEAQWDPLTYSVLRLDANRIFTPQYEVDIVGTELQEHRVWWGWKRYTASLTVNRILSPSWGLTTGVIGKKFDPSISGSHDFSELNALLQLAFLHRSGWSGFLRSYLVRQDLTDRGDSFYGLADVGLGYEFPGKRGFASLEITNIFDRHFYYQKEFVTFDALYPNRRVLFRLGFYF